MDGDFSGLIQWLENGYDARKIISYRNGVGWSNRNARRKEVMQAILNLSTVLMAILLPSWGKWKHLSKRLS